MGTRLLSILLSMAFAALLVCLPIPGDEACGQTSDPGRAPGAGTGGAGVSQSGNADGPFGTARQAPTFPPAPSGPVPFAASSPGSEEPGSVPGPSDSGFPAMETTTSGSAGIGTGTDSTYGGSGTSSFGPDRETAGAAVTDRPGEATGGNEMTPGTPMGGSRQSPAGPPSRFPSAPGSVPFGGSMEGMSSGGAGARGGSSAGFPGGDAAGTFGTGIGGIRGGPGGGQR